MPFDSFNDELDNMSRTEPPSQNNKPNYSNQNNQNRWNGGNNKGGNNTGKWNNNKKWTKKEPEDPSKFELYRPYVITGNKDAPVSVIEAMKRIVKDLEALGYTTRTGGLEGPDQAVEPISTRLELYLPWQGFNNKESKFYFNTATALVAAGKFHPTFESLSGPVKAFLSKNARMVLGEKLNSSAHLLICWSEDGVETAKEKTVRTGNIGHVIAIANTMRIPIFNLGKADAEQRLRTYLSI